MITENAILYCNPCWQNSAIGTGSGEVTISNNLIAYNFTGGIMGSIAPTIEENIIIQNQGIPIDIQWTDIFHPGGGSISHNIFADNTPGIDVGALRIQRYTTLNTTYNSIVRNTALNNSAIFQEDSSETGDSNVVSANTIVGNINLGAPPDLRTVSILGRPLFNDNNIYNNTDYALYYRSPQGSDNLNAENNWWGTANNLEIQGLIYDWFDDPTLAIVDFNPYRTDFNLDAPVSPQPGWMLLQGLLPSA